MHHHGLPAAFFALVTLFAGCTSFSSYQNSFDNLDSTRTLGGNRLTKIEVQRRFGDTAEDNPFIPRKGMFSVKKDFTVIELRNATEAEVVIRSIMCIDNSGKVLAKVLSSDELEKYWRYLPVFRSTIEDKAFLLTHKYLQMTGLIGAHQTKIIVIESKMELDGPFVLEITSWDGRILKLFFN